MSGTVPLVPEPRGQEENAAATTKMAPCCISYCVTQSPVSHTFNAASRYLLTQHVNKTLLRKFQETYAHF
jgi:hypothetical protein